MGRYKNNKDGTKTLIAGRGNTDIIESQIGYVEPADTAASAHAIGSYFINKSGQFVKTTTAIAVGDTIAVGTNVVATDIAGVLGELNSKTAFKQYLNTGTKNNNYLVPDQYSGCSLNLYIYGNICFIQGDFNCNVDIPMWTNLWTDLPITPKYTIPFHLYLLNWQADNANTSSVVFHGTNISISGNNIPAGHYQFFGSVPLV